MRKLIPVVYIAVIVMMSCHRSSLPTGILTQEKMQAVMWDMVNTGEFLNGFVFPKDTSINQATTSQIWYAKIFQLHHITQEQFEKSYQYYKDHPAVMKELLDSLSNKQFIPDSSGSPKVDTAGKPAHDSLNLRKDSLKRQILRTVKER